MLRAFDEVVPGAASRIIAMAEAEQQHTHRMDADVLSKIHSEQRFGQCAAVFLAVLFLGGALYCANIGQPWVAGILGGTTVMALVSAFVLGRIYRPAPESESKNNHAPK